MHTPAHFSSKAAPPEKPLPLWILYPLFFVGVYLAHFSLLRLPWFWDEAGYYVPAALDFFRTGSLIPHSTLTNAHPPLPSILLAAWWHLTGYVISGTRTFLCMIAAAALLGVFRLARTLAGPLAAAAVTLLTAIYPVWFAQSTMAHADLFAAAFTLWALAFYFERFAHPATRPGAANLALVAVLFSLAALSKETAIVTPAALALWEAVLLLTRPRKPLPASVPPSLDPVPSAGLLIALALPALPLALWYAYHFRQTGFIFGNPEFFRYNATANLSAMRVLASLWHRLVHLTVNMNLYVAVACAGAVLFMPRRPHASPLALTRPTLMALGVVLAANTFAFSFLGGALLTRYLLPLYPLILLIVVGLWQERLRLWGALAALTAAAFLAALFLNPPYSIAPEDNLTYRDFVVLHQQAIGVIAKRFPYATVLTAWPATTELEHPDLGYTRTPIRTSAINDFTLPELQKAAADPGAYDTALIFSTKWVPPPGTLDLGRHSASTDARYFDFHKDLNPQQAARLLQGEVVWQAQRHGEWAAVLRFARSNEARNGGLF